MVNCPLAELLKQDSYLIVVDYQVLLLFLHELATPNKFLLTSRHSLRVNWDNLAAIYFREGKYSEAIKPLRG